MTAKTKRASKKPVEAPQSDATPTPVVLAYKGFDANLQCRGFQYEVGRTYEHKGSVTACRSGFHACENPFDVLGCYGFYQTRFALVELSGELSRGRDGTKLAAGCITIRAELKLPEFIQAGINWIWDRVDPAKIDTSAPNAENNDGNDAQIGSSGYAAQIGSSGYAAQIGSSGTGAQIGSSGNDAQIGSSGYAAQIGSSGTGAQIGSSGNDAQIGSSGNGAQIGSSGNGARIGSSGYAARIGSSGNDARIDSTGENAVIACAGSVYRFRVGSGGCISAPYHDGARIRFVTLYEGENIQAGVWYALDATGNPVAVED